METRKGNTAVGSTLLPFIICRKKTRRVQERHASHKRKPPRSSYLWPSVAFLFNRHFSVWQIIIGLKYKKKKKKEKFLQSGVLKVLRRPHYYNWTVFKMYFACYYIKIIFFIFKNLFLISPHKKYLKINLKF